MNSLRVKRACVMRKFRSFVPRAYARRARQCGLWRAAVARSERRTAPCPHDSQRWCISKNRGGGGLSSCYSPQAESRSSGISRSRPVCNRNQSFYPVLATAGATKYRLGGGTYDHSSLARQAYDHPTTTTLPVPQQACLPTNASINSTFLSPGGALALCSLFTSPCVPFFLPSPRP